MVVVVMHIFGETKSISPNAYAKNSAKKAKLGSKLKRLGLNQPRMHLEETQRPLLVKRKASRVLLDTGSSGDLLFLGKGSNRYIPIVNRADPESWSTSNGTFKTKKVGDVELSFVEYSSSKRVYLRLDIVEYPQGGTQPLYDLIIGKQTLHDLGTA